MNIKFLSPKLASLAMLVFFLSLISSCEKKEKLDPSTDGRPVEINLVGLKSDGGFSYKIGYTLPIYGDDGTTPNASKLILYENGIELSPAHSNHQSIRDYGQGQYCHWENTLYFSSTDNTNPLQNGRKYSYVIK